jgi:hypothetical protein
MNEYTMQLSIFLESLYKGSFIVESTSVVDKLKALLNILGSSELPRDFDQPGYSTTLEISLFAPGECSSLSLSLHWQWSCVTILVS